MQDSEGLDNWLLDHERWAILPFKAALWAVTLILWLWQTRWILPGLPVFGTFSAYFFFLVAGAFLLLLRRVKPHEARAYCLVSYFLDIVFISVLIYLDQRRLLAAGGFGVSDFFYFYFLIVLRGYCLTSGRMFNLIINLLLVAIFLASFALAQMSLAFLVSGLFQMKLALLWILILMSWFIVGLIDKYRVELMSARENALRTQHLADLGQMAAAMAHEINNPLGIISINAEFLLRKYPDDWPDRWSLQTICDESQRCKAIFADLMALTRPLTGGQPVRVDVAALCREVIPVALRPGKETEQRLTFEAQAATPAALVDPQALRRALLNALLNARLAIVGDEGHIAVQVGPAGKKDDLVAVAIRDNGPTPSPEDMRKAFEPLFTRRPGGTGLGLAVARRLVDAMGGHMTVGVAPQGQGMVVTIHLPAAAKPAHEAPPPAPPAPSD